MIQPYKNSRGEFAQRPSKNLLPPPKGCKRCMGERCLRMCPDGVIKTLESFPMHSDLCLVCTNDKHAMLPVEPQSNKLTEAKVKQLIREEFAQKARQLVKEEIAQGVRQMIREEVAQKVRNEVKLAMLNPEFTELINKAAKKAILFVLQSATPVRKKSIDKPQR